MQPVTDPTTLAITPDLAIPLAELDFRFSRSSGPGGQHVQRADTRVELLFDVARSPSLTENQRERIRARLAGYLDNDGVLHLFSSASRSQLANRADVIARFQALLARAELLEMYWGQVHWLLIKAHLLQVQATYLLAGDEVVVTKAGHETYGLDRFFSSLFGKPVPGLAFFAFALINVQQRTAHPLRIGQVLRPETPAEPAPAPTAAVVKRGRGRPKGSKNRNKSLSE